MKWMDKLKEYAPDIAVAIASGGATLPALALKAVSEAVGQDINNEQALASFVEEANPEVMLKVKQSNNAFKIRMRELDVELEQAELKNMEHARDSHKHSKMPAIINVMLTILVAIGGYLLFAADIPEANSQIAYIFFGTVLAKWGDSIAYWVGTTRSSATKTLMLKK